jgi:hypothetical protein
VLQPKRSTADDRAAHEPPPPPITAQLQAAQRGHSLSRVSVGGSLPPTQLLEAGDTAPQQGGLEGGSAAPQAEASAEQIQTSAPNHTGLPDGLKAGVEALSGVSLDQVRVHFNSSRPAELSALAYAQGTDIHVGPGQEQHLPHEAWHVVQQMQGRVHSTTQAKGVEINDDAGLEQEADEMGAKAVQMRQVSGAEAGAPLQRAADSEEQPLDTPDPSPSGKTASLMSTTRVAQLFTAPPAAPPAAGVRGGNLNADGVPDESYITTLHGQPNDLVGSVPGAVINGWPYIQGVNATGTWIRFHLVNHNIGGLGTQDNLVPTSQVTNHNPSWRSFEETCKHHVGQQTSVHVTVEVQYPAANPAAVAGTLGANQHFYPTLISARCYLWDATANAYVLKANGAPPQQQTFSVQIVPFPLLPPANATQTDLRQQSSGWLRNTLLGGGITVANAKLLAEALQPGQDIDDYISMSNEATPEMQLLDALESFIEVELQAGRGKVPLQSKIHIVNGSYHI